jgi:4-hydroxybenzoate polyprenyltransferase
MPTIRALLKASHFGPTLLVTTIGFSFALDYYNPTESIAIAVAIFSGQLIVGWSNDLIDYKDDLSHKRQNKPLVAEHISYATLQRTLIALIPISLALTIASPLGVKGGLVYFFGIGCGAAYNLYFKFTALSPLPYALAFAALPSCIPISLNQNPPQWMWLGGALLGMAAHFINVIKDMEQDRASNIRGLPQRIGKKSSILAAAALIILGALVIFL